MSFHNSTGPITAAGKETVSRNGLKHGLSGRKYAYLEGERDAFEAHVKAYMASVSPIGLQEESLARLAAENVWRLRRAHAMENAALDQFAADQIETESESGEAGESTTPAAAQAQAWLDATKGLQRLALYISRIGRALQKDTAALAALQDERKARYAKAEEEAVALTLLARSPGQSFNPAQYFSGKAHGGFAYSAPEIAQIIDRTRRLAQARTLLSQPSTPPEGARK